MNFELTPDQVAFREKIFAFVASKLNSAVESQECLDMISLTAWRLCCEFGLQRLILPSDQGGMGHSALDSALAFEALGSSFDDNGFSFWMAAHLSSFVIPLAVFGNSQQKDQWLAPSTRGEIMGCHALTEKNSGSDAMSLTTVARPVDDDFLISGAKAYISGAAQAQVAIVYASVGENKSNIGSVSAFLVPLDFPGVRRGKALEKLGLKSCPMSAIEFDQVRVPRSYVLGKIGGGYSLFQLAMAWERVLLSAVHVGIMERIFNKTLNHVNYRSQFGASLGRNQAVSHPLVDSRIAIECSRLLTYQAASRLNFDSSDLGTTAMAKIFVSQSYVDLARKALQFHGASGYLVETGIERELRDALASTIHSGTTEIQKNILAAQLGL